MLTNKKKIVNDPVYGFININHPLVFDLIGHRYFQRLRHIKQLGVTYLVYPGATHSRFQHALGAMHLVELAIGALRAKGHRITKAEAEAVSVAILLHDIGHGPFSHTLESSLAQGVSHEVVGRWFLHALNREFNGKLGMAIEVLEGSYPKRFLHQLVNSQLDMDRMDYLRRDSFFSGVTEGAIGSDRIIKMLNVVDDQLVVEAKGIYSIEKFLIARRLMYWQVYLHKTVVVAERMMLNMLLRAREIALQGVPLSCTGPLHYFLSNRITLDSFCEENNSPSQALENFAMLDDSDIIVAAKSWITHPDPTLATLSSMIINRNLLSVELSSKPFAKEIIMQRMENFQKKFPELKESGKFFVLSATVSNNTYKPTDESIKILYNSGKLVDITQASDMLNTKTLSEEVKKFFLCYPKEL